MRSRRERCSKFAKLICDHSRHVEKSASERSPLSAVDTTLWIEIEDGSGREAYDSMVLGEGIPITDPCVYIQESYDSGITDEFVVPAVVMEDVLRPPSSNGVRRSSSIFADRARQIVRALTEPEFDGFQRKEQPRHFSSAIVRHHLQYVHVAYLSQIPWDR